MEDREEIKTVLHMLRQGYQYQTEYHNLADACQCYREARKGLEKIYGRDSSLCSIVNVFDYPWEVEQGDYRTAALKLADAEELLEQFGEQDVVDEFTAWIFENKKEMMEGVVTDTLNVLQNFDISFSLEDMLIQSMMNKNDLEETINRTWIDPMGLPRRFHYVIQNIQKYASDISPDMLHKAAEMYSFIRDMENKDLSAVSENEKINITKTIYELLEQGSFIWKDIMGAGSRSFMDSKRTNMNFDIARGMMGFGEAEFADSILKRLKGENDFRDFDSQIKIKLLECELAYKKGNKAEAETILDDIIQMENNVILQVFFMRNEQEKSDFLKGIEYLLKRTAKVCIEIRGIQEAYSLVVRTRTLSFDHANIHLNSDKHKFIIQEMQQLEMRKNAGESVYGEKEKLMKYFEKESQGIFDLDSGEICRKLPDGHAVLEFTAVTDERDWEFYYVFVATARGVSGIYLGECREIDKSIEGISQYITNYAINKYSGFQIRMLPEYRMLYEKVLEPTGEILPHNIHNLYIAGAGKFLEIPFGMLPCFRWYDKFMEEEYHISYINSGKEILRGVRAALDREAVVLGNPDFEGKFPELPSSAKEVEAVAEILKVRPITGKEVLPECLKRQAGIFHIATHSYDENETDSGHNADAMETSGLVFAGGRLLSARQISQMDMRKTDLVVLSVCGVREGKGVCSDLGPGVRRAFVNAGVRHIILNLWKTDDNAAELLMKCFYDHYIRNKMNVEEALRTAKQYLRTNSVDSIRRSRYYDESMEKVFTLMKEAEIPYAHPYYWAGFIILGV